MEITIIEFSILLNKDLFKLLIVSVTSVMELILVEQEINTVLCLVVAKSVLRRLKMWHHLHFVLL